MQQELTKRLATLKTQAQAQTATYQTSRDQLHQSIVDAYLWWRDAQTQPNYLDATYKSVGIKSRKRSSNSPNFYPLVRLIWNIDISKQAGTVSNWARSMLALHEEYVANPNLYAKDPRADLLNFIKDEGGLGGIRGERTMTAEELAEEEEAGLPQETRGRPIVTAPPPTQVTKSKLDTAKAVAAKAVIASFPTAVTNSDNLVVMLGRRNAAGKIEVIGSDYSEDLVQTALEACTALDRSNVTPSLRLLAEALEPHALPAKLEKYRKKFFDDSEVERTVTLKQLDDNGQPKTQVQRVKQATRLRYRPSNKDFLVSKTATPASIVSYVKPHTAFDCSDEVILRGEDRSWIERELLNQQKLTLYTASPEHGLDPTTGSVKASYMLNLEDAEAAHTRRLYFYEKSTVPVETNEQPAVRAQATATWDWQLETTVQWLAEFDAQCATPYVKKIRGFFNRSQFASLQLQIGKTDLELRYWWDEKAKAYAENYSLPFKTNAKRTDKRASTKLFTSNAKDLALVFAVLPTLPITSSHVQLAGNSHVMRLTYSTALADYETYIPAADTEGARDTTAFEMYGA